MRPQGGLSPGDDEVVFASAPQDPSPPIVILAFGTYFWEHPHKSWIGSISNEYPRGITCQVTFRQLKIE